MPMLSTLENLKKAERRSQLLSSSERWRMSGNTVNAMTAFEEPLKERKDRLELEKKMFSLGDRSKPFIIIQRLRMAMQTPPEDRTEAQMMNIMALCSVGCRVYGEQSVKVLRRLCSKARLEAFKKGQEIFRAGDEGVDWAAVVFGTVAIVEVSKFGFRKKIGAVQKGFAFGDKSLISGERRFASCIAETTCEILMVDKETYLRAFQNPIPDIIAFVTHHVKPLKEFEEDDPELLDFAQMVMLGKLQRGDVLEVDFIDGLYIFTRGAGVIYLGPQSESELRSVLESRSQEDNEDGDEQKHQKEKANRAGGKQTSSSPPSRLEITQENWKLVSPNCKELSKVVPGDFIGESLGMDEVDWKEYPRGLLVLAVEPMDFYKVPANLFANVNRKFKFNLASEGKFRMRYFVGRQGGAGSKREVSVEEATIYGGDRNKTFYENAAVKYPRPCQLFPPADPRPPSHRQTLRSKLARPLDPTAQPTDPLYVPYRVHKWRKEHPNEPSGNAPWKVDTSHNDKSLVKPLKNVPSQANIYDLCPDELIIPWLPPILSDSAQLAEDQEELRPLNMDPPKRDTNMKANLNTKKDDKDHRNTAYGSFKRRSVFGTA
mmetsp:Transcript_5528/g.7471  ORF Transcript_5528/g.7471 Transcript_5528/m.7471 type:complete len:601 (-) Transcript_5528:63-1865(-)